MKKITLAIIVVFGGIISCSPFEEPEFFGVMNVDDVELEGISGTNISMTASGLISPCEQVEQIEIISREDAPNGEIIDYRIMLGVINTTCGSFNGDDNSSGSGSGPGADPLLVPISVPVSFQYGDSDTYIFRFIRTNNTFFEKTISVVN